MATLLRMKLRQSQFLRCLGPLRNQSRPPRPRFPTSNHSPGIPTFLAYRLFPSARLGSDCKLESPKADVDDKDIQTDEAEPLSPLDDADRISKRMNKAGLIPNEVDLLNGFPRLPLSRLMRHRLGSDCKSESPKADVDDKDIQIEEAEPLSPAYEIFTKMKIVGFRKMKNAGLIPTVPDEVFWYMMNAGLIPTNAFYDYPQLPLPRLILPRPQYYCRSFFRQNFFRDALFVITWKYDNCLLPVRNQLDTDICYGFTIVDCVYTHDCIFGDSVEQLSVQQFQDHYRKVAKIKDEEGSYIENTAAYIIWYGLCTEQDYPWYHGESRCLPRHFASMKRRYIKGVEFLSFDEVPKRLSCGNVLYLSVFISPSMLYYLTWFGYQDICLHNAHERCQIDNNEHEYESHAMVCIGYGESYWLVKNSWGEKVGFHGFHKILKSDVLTIVQVIL